MAEKKNNTNPSIKKLSILISQDGLSFFSSQLILEEKELVFVEKHFEQMLGPAEILPQIKRVFEENKHFNGPIEKLEVIFANNLFAFVPRSLFDEKHLSDYLKFNTKILENDFIAFDELKNCEVNNVYVPYTNLNNYFFERFGEFDYSHSMSLWAENTLNLPEETTDGTFYVNVFQKHFELSIVKEGKLLLCNTFSFEAPEDFVYYLLFVAEQLKLYPEKFQLKFAGAISETSENYKRCYTYIRNCSFLKAENDDRQFNFSEKAKFNPHYFLLSPHFYAHHLRKI